MLPNQNFSENSTVASGRHSFNLSTNVTIYITISTLEIPPSQTLSVDAMVTV